MYATPKEGPVGADPVPAEKSNMARSPPLAIFTPCGTLWDTVGGPIRRGGALLMPPLPTRLKSIIFPAVLLEREAAPNAAPYLAPFLEKSPSPASPSRARRRQRPQLYSKWIIGAVTVW